MKTGIFLAILAALYAINSPLSKIMLTYMPPHNYFIALDLMIVGAFLCASDGPVFPKWKKQ